MIKAFGDYHRIFWNCQTFAKCFLKVICEEPAEFDAWTIAEASNLVAPPIPLPLNSLPLSAVVFNLLANGSSSARSWSLVL